MEKIDRRIDRILLTFWEKSSQIEWKKNSKEFRKKLFKVLEEEGWKPLKEI